MLDLSFRYRFEAAHRFLSSASQACMTPHGHSWHATLNLRFQGTQLDKASMTANFAELKGGWKRLLQDTFDHSYMHHWQDPLAETLNACQPEARLIPFPGDPTTELIAVLLFHKMETHFKKSPFENLIAVQSIRIEETETNQIQCGREFYSQEIRNYKDFTGWWAETDLENRSLARK